ncbi:MAG: alkaline phosphatase family protein, partial [Chitinophagaceae bacterium]|nr:alkaline phosphatase family protein [Chitinophagaceae bacterium]
YITTDHGRDSVSGKHHGGQSARERTTWIVTNAKDLNENFKKKPAIVDIFPSLMSWLQVSTSVDKLMEVDGVNLTGAISAIEPRASYKNDSIHLQWTAIQKEGTAKVWLSKTNKFKKGGKDKYSIVATADVAKEKISFEVKGARSDFYKVVIEFPHNLLNRWIVVQKDSNRKN